ncbi:MAG: NUDIX hydrolase [Acidobacteriota bacterium]|jgi:ADP-ribose pyrophosphatase YjhB (NUDIX family)|nr:NUDIX hydrolase [Acidobacteriota bacterium]
MHKHPVPAVDAIIAIEDGIVLIERRFPPYGWALPGGFVEWGETVEVAVRREVREETGLELDQLKLFGVYSDPDRDPRRHTISVVFTAVGIGIPRAGDDAGEIAIVSPRAPGRTLAFDHNQILADYLESGNDEIR